MRLRKLWTTALLLLLAGCGDLTGTEGVEASGSWSVVAKGDPQWFFDLTEQADGGIRGTWSWPGITHGNGVRGRREGRKVTLVADSHNAFPVLVHLTQVRKNRMEGQMELDNSVFEVTFIRD